jgi:hypothetical protein
MVRLSSLLTLLGLLSTPLVAAAFNETEQNENATCDVSNIFSSFANPVYIIAMRDTTG